ncbi:YitT family protein [Vallitalea maricola]|uniref:YitT family protein n=1 Tax=Vallitalea maricola TaxID=3074433 RepID=A0ACB5UKU5_9FIRM|nr:YitT family protein [Vallitalea sp. AN17-2]
MNVIKKCIGVLLGSFIFAAAINAIYVPFQFLDTGISGVALLLNFLFGWSIPLLVFALNIIFVILGFRLVNKSFGLYSILGIASSSLFLYLTKDLTIEIDNIIVAVVFGGLILGIGVGIAIRSGGSIGGMNILAKIVNKYFSISIGTFDMCFNIILVAVACFVFNINIAMYTIMARFVAVKTIDGIIEGFNHKKSILIISKEYQKIADKLMIDPKRGVTYLRGVGAYTGESKNMIYCVVKLTQLSKVKQIVHTEDPQAFMSIIDTNEVDGKGFR